MRAYQSCAHGTKFLRGRDRYCGIYSPSSVVKCVKTGKWFCNARITGTASCIVTHMVYTLSQDCRCAVCVGLLTVC